MQVASGSYKPALEGVRALAFLLVFAVHYSGPTWTLEGRTPWAYPWLLLCQLSFCAVPLFFALSGYLITGVLLRTVRDDGFFRNFYFRRALRVLPLYYVILAGIACAALAMHTHFLLRHGLLVCYLFNFWPYNGYYNINHWIQIGHFWSLAVEEQFYLLWPVAIWFVRDRRKLRNICYGVIAASFAGRLSWPWWPVQSFEFVYQNTLFRCDAIMLGCALALYEGEAAAMWKKLVMPARLSLLAGAAVIVARALIHNEAMPFDNFGVMVIMPLLSLMGASFVVLALHPGTLTARASTARWAVYLGKRSYGLYLLHQLFRPWVLERFVPYLTSKVGRGCAFFLGVLLAFAITWALAELAFRFVEEPALRLKKHIRFGKPSFTAAGRLTREAASPAFVVSPSISLTE